MGRLWIYEVNLRTVHNLIHVWKLFRVDFWTPWIFQNFMYVSVRTTYNATFNHDEWMLLSLGVTFFCFFSHNLGLTFVREIKWRYKVFCQKRNVYLSNIGVQQKKGVIFQEEHCIFCQFANIWHFLKKQIVGLT